MILIYTFSRHNMQTPHVRTTGTFLMHFCSLSKPGLWLWSKHWSLWYLSHLLFLFWIQKGPKVPTKQGRRESTLRRESVVSGVGRIWTRAHFWELDLEPSGFWVESITVRFRTGSWGHDEGERGRDERARVNMRSAVEMRMRERDCETPWHQRTVPPPLNTQQRRLRASNQSCLPANNREAPTTLPFLSSPSTLVMLCCGAGALEAWPPGERSSCSSSAAAPGLCPVTGVGRNFPENHTEVIDLL